jgi:acetolactate synthase-1/3 small subunit
MCIVLKGQDGVIEQARRQLEDLVPVWAVLDYTNTSVVERELLIAKISILGPEYAQAQIQSVPDEEAIVRTFESSGKASDGQTLHPNLPTGVTEPELYPTRREMSASEALIAKNLHLSAIKTLADQFGGRVVDVAEESCIIELTAKSSRVESFLGLIRHFGVLEAARSGEWNVVLVERTWSAPRPDPRLTSVPVSGPHI